MFFQFNKCGGVGIEVGPRGQRCIDILTTKLYTLVDAGCRCRSFIFMLYMIAMKKKMKVSYLCSTCVCYT